MPKGVYRHKKGKESNNWKGEQAGYRAKHIWLRSNYGKAKKCEGKSCKGISKNYQWALIKGKICQHKRENFMQLCASCHKIYDQL